MAKLFRIRTACAKCGGTVAALPRDEGEKSIAKCDGCGIALGWWRDIRSNAEVVENPIGDG